MSSRSKITGREMALHLGHNVSITHRDRKGALVETVGLLKGVACDHIQIRMGTDLNVGEYDVRIAIDAFVSLNDYDSA